MTKILEEEEYMQSISTWFRRAVCRSREERGASAVEYALIAGLIAVAIVVVLQSLGTDLVAVFEKIQEALK